MIKYDPFDEINAIFPAFWHKNNYAFTHPDRKTIITKYIIHKLIGIDNIEIIYEKFKASIPICHSCGTNIIDLLYLYYKEGLISKEDSDSFSKYYDSKITTEFEMHSIPDD